MKIHNVLQCNIKKIEESSIINSGDFIYDFKMLKKGLILMNQKFEQFIVTDLYPMITLEEISTNIKKVYHHEKIGKHFFYWYI